MSAVRRRATRLGIVVALALPAGAIAASPSLRASFGAAYAAFRDPSLIAAPGPRPALAPEPFTLPLPQLVPVRTDAELDADLAREFASADATELDERGGPSLARLAMPELKVPITRRTLRYVRFFTETAQGRAAFTQRLRRFGKYRGIIEPALREAGLPEDLAWVAAVESGFDPRAVSKAGAAGMWQFMPETGRVYGLEQSAFVDDRMSLVRSTSAAATHLRDLFERFGRWDLALAAYNLGAQGVLQAMDRVLAAELPGQRREPVGFADLAQRRAIPDETASYVPQITAFAIVAVNRARFGFDEVELLPGTDLAELAVPPGTRLATIARAAGVPMSAIRDDNPELLQDRVPEAGGDYVVHVPSDLIGRTVATFPSYSDHEIMSDDEASQVAEETLPLDWAGALVLGARDTDLDQAVRLEGPALAAWASLDDAPQTRPRWLGKNRLPFFAPPTSWSVPAAAGDPAAMLFAMASRGAMPSPKLAPLDAFDGRLSMAELISSGGLRDRRTGRSLRDVGSFTSVPVPDAPAPALSSAPRVAWDAAPEGVVLVRPEAPPVIAAPRMIPTRSFVLSSGVAVEVARDRSLREIAITVRLVEPEPLAPIGGGETAFALHVKEADLDLGVAFAAARLRALAAQGSREVLTELRRKASEPRRRELEREAYGSAWLTLGDTLFPAGHPLAGTVVGARSDARGALDAWLVEAMRRQRAAGRATIAITGDVTEERVRPLLEAAVGSIHEADDLPIAGHPRDERVEIEADVPDVRVLYGWVAPAEGERGEAATRVALELLTGKRSRAREVMVREAQIAVSIEGRFDAGERASVMAIQVVPSVVHGASGVEQGLRAAIDELAGEAPAAVDVAFAKGVLRSRLERERDVAQGGARKKAPVDANSARIRRALTPGALDRAVASLDAVTPEDVREAFARAFPAEHRVVVVTTPRRKLAAPRATP